MAEIYAAVAALAPELVSVVPKAVTYARDLRKKYPVR
jgi:hypothetical protein